MAISVFVPFLRSQFLPGMVRNAMLITLAAFISAATIGLGPLPIDPLSDDILILLAKEAAVGVMMGFVVGVSFWIPQLLGDFVDNQRGTSIAQIFNPAAGGEASQMGVILSLLFTTLFLLAGGFIALLDLVIQSYRIIGVTDLIPNSRTEEILAAVTQIFNDLVAIGVLLAAPIVFVMMTAELGLGLVGRFVQQLQVFFLAMPIKSVISLALMIIYIDILLRIYDDYGLPLEPLRKLMESFGNG